MSDVLEPAQQRKPRLLVLVASAMHLRDFSDCSALSLLSERFEVDFVYTDPEIGKQLPTTGLKYQYSNPLPRYWLWNCASTLEYMRKYRGLIAGMNRQFFNRKRSGKIYWHWSASAGYLAYRVGGGPIIVPFIKWLLNRTFNFALRVGRGESYSAAVVPTVLRDLAAEDMIRWARTVGIPSIAVQGNWDCFNLKEMLAKPDHFLVWGEQSWYFARVLEKMAHSSLHVVGSQRHDHYLQDLPSKVSARRRLGLSLERPIVLFCGAISPFDEQAALHELDGAITTGLLPANLQVLYKPHPRTTADKKVNEFDQQRYKHVSLIAYRGRGIWNSLDEYPTLLRSVDATISPYSTMGLESALCGRPTMCLGYHPDANLPYWRHAREFLHLQSYRFAPWAICCDRQEDFIVSVQRLLQLAAEPDIEERTINSTFHIIFRNESRYAERLCRAIDSIIEAKPERTPKSAAVAAC